MFFYPLYYFVISFRSILLSCGTQKNTAANFFVTVSFFDNLPEMSCRIDQRFLMYRCIRFFGIAAE